MKSKKDVIIIEENPHFTNKLKEKLEDKVNIINIESIKEALECCGISSEMKYEKGNICPDIVVIGDGCKISKDLQNRLKEELPKLYNQKMLEEFMPAFYCNLFKNGINNSLSKSPKVCICADLKQYPIKGKNQDITAKLG